MPYVETGSARIHYSIEGSGPPVVLVQGVGVIGNGWKPQVDALRDRFRLTAIDNRGIGDSTSNGPLTIEDMASDVLAVAAAEGMDRFHLAGHSMGGIIAQQVALQAPARVLTLALLCTFLRGKQGTLLAPRLLGAALRSRIGTRPMRRRAFVELVMPRAYLATQDRDRLATDLGTLFGRDLADSPPIIMRQLKAMGRYDASAQLGQLAHIPTLVVSAEHDGIAQAKYGRALAAAIPGARYVEIPDVAHALPIQRPDVINRLLAEHWSAAGVTP